MTERGLKHLAAGNTAMAKYCLDTSKKTIERRKKQRRKTHEQSDKEKKRQKELRPFHDHILAKGPAGRLEDVALLFQGKDLFKDKQRSYADCVVLASEAAPEIAEEYAEELSKSNAALTLDGEVDLDEKARIEKYIESRIAKGASLDEIDDAMSPALYAAYQEASGFAPVAWED